MSQLTIEIFSAGCPLCDEVVTAVGELACTSCDVSVSDLRDASVAERARAQGVARAPSVVIDGVLADCCRGGVDLARLREVGLGQSVEGEA